MMAKSIMRALDNKIQVDQRLSDALDYFCERRDRQHLLVLDGTEVAGVLDRDTVMSPEIRESDFHDEMIGNLSMARMRLCRLDDEISVLKPLFDGNRTDVVVVTDAVFEPKGLIFREDFPSNGKEEAAKGRQ